MARISRTKKKREEASPKFEKSDAHAKRPKRSRRTETVAKLEATAATKTASGNDKKKASLEKKKRESERMHALGQKRRHQ